MIHTVTLDDKTEAALQKRAARQGMTISEYVVKIAAQAANQRSRSSSKSTPQSKTGAQVIADMEAEGILTGYGDPSKSAKQLAEELRSHFSQPRILE